MSCVALLPSSSEAQGTRARAGQPRDTTHRAAAMTPQIQDNSFLVEEAYNQTPGVVQSISTFQYFGRTGAFVGQFTQEWPVGGLSNQLSYSLSVVRSEAARPAGLGDVLVNYRYQLVGSGDARLAVAPRLSLVLPAGSYRLGRGAGAPGLEVALPVSILAAQRLAAHGNVGFALTPDARNSVGARADVRDWFAAGSVAWLARPRLNLLLEYRYDHTASVVAPGTTVCGSQTTLSPGIRWAYNFPSGLQIVPGVAVPLSLADDTRERRVLLYLSFEGPSSRVPGARARVGSGRRGRAVAGSRGPRWLILTPTQLQER